VYIALCASKLMAQVSQHPERQGIPGHNSEVMELNFHLLLGNLTSVWHFNAVWRGNISVHRSRMTNFLCKVPVPQIIVTVSF